jgi:hypothetical protein
MSRRAIAASVAVFACAASASPRLELEVGGGLTAISQLAPTFTGRIGLELMGWFTPSVRVMSLTPLSARAMGWSVLAELRAHTPGRVQLTGGLALGVASASFTARSGVMDARVDQVAPYLWADLGLRVILGPFWIGAAVGGAPFDAQLMVLANVGVAIGD